jgi:trigger factor
MAKEQQTTELKNTVTIEEAGPCKKKIVVEIPEEAIRKATDERYETLRKEALVPGFRKGRAPRRLLEKRFGKETSEQVKLKLLADASDLAIKDNELDTLREPDVDFEKIELPDSGSLKFDFEVEVRPEFELPELKGIAVEKKTLEVTAEQVDGELKQLQKYAGLWAPRKSGAAVELEDQIIADVVLKAEGAEEKEKLDNVEIHVRPNGFVGAIPVEKLDELLVGAKADQTKKITVEVPKTYFREEYRGKKVDIEIAIKDIKWLKAAELNEDFLKRFGVEDESQLREKLRDSLRNRLEQQVRGDMAEQIYKYMLDNTNFELPTDIVAEHSETLLQRQYVSLLQRGLAREQIEEHMEQLRAGSEQQAAEQLKTFFIMDKVADKLKVEVNEEEINGHIAQLAIQRGQRPERMREQMLRDGSLAQFRLQVRENKCIAKLLESAKITEVEPKKKAKKTSTKAAKKKQPKKRKATAKPR